MVLSLCNSVDWMKVERDLIKNYHPLLHDITDQKALLKWDVLKLKYFNFTPSIGILRSQSIEGDCIKITLSNLSHRYLSLFTIDRESIPRWLILPDGRSGERIVGEGVVISPHSSYDMTVKNDHTLATLR